MAQSIVELACPSCGANLELKPGVEHIACAFCGKALFVNRGDNTLLAEPSGQASDRAGTVPQNEQTPKPEVVQEDPRVHQRLADQAVLPRVEQERIAAEVIVAQDSHRLNQLHSNIQRNQLFGFSAFGCGLLFSACILAGALGAILEGLDGRSSASQTIGQVFFDLCFGGTILAVGCFMLLALRSAARRQSAQAEELEQQDRATRSELARLREQEAQVRRRLAG